jgi:DNA-binding NarL/FixJ family response regulator
MSLLLAPADAFTVVHIEDDPFWAGFVGDLIRRLPKFRVGASVATGREGVERSRALAPDIVLLDLRLPDLDGFEVLAALAAQPRPPRVLLLSCRMDDLALSRLKFSEVAGMISKSPDMERCLLTGLEVVAGGGRFFSPEVQAALRRFQAAPDALHKILSVREQEVLRLIASGHTDAEIAAAIGIARATAHTHRQNLMDKVGVHTAAKLQLWAREKGFG